MLLCGSQAVEKNRPCLPTDLHNACKRERASETEKSERERERERGEQGERSRGTLERRGIEKLTISVPTGGGAQ